MPPKRSEISNFAPRKGLENAKRNTKEETMATKILFVNQEIAPYVPETAMAAAGRDAVYAAQAGKFEIRTFTPKWGVINERRGQLHEVIRLSGMNIVVDDADHPILIKVASLPKTRTQVYFIDNDDYFTKRGLAADEDGREYGDNGERAVFFARGVLETVMKLRWNPDIIVCQGWMAAAIPFYVKTAYSEEPPFASAKVVTSLFGGGLENGFGPAFKRNVAYKGGGEELLEGYSDAFGPEDIARFAIDYSDGVMEGEAGAPAEAVGYAKGRGLPLLPFAGGDQAEARAEFYKGLLG